MVPTEVLAVQHYEHLTSLLNKFDGDDKPNIALLTGSTSTRESRIIRNACCSPYSFHSSSICILKYIFIYILYITGSQNWRYSHGHWNTQLNC
jgi:hypothetical protein